MAYRKKCFRYPGNSILESVIALSVISVCLYIAILVYATAFSPKTAPKFYGSRNQADEQFFLIQVNNDSLQDNQDENLVVEEEYVNANLKKVTLKRKDSLQVSSGKSYFIQLND